MQTSTQIPAQHAIQDPTKEPKEITRVVLKNPLDMHLHLRDGVMMRAVLPFSARSFLGALIMPNLTPPIDSLESARAYEKRILECAKQVGCDDFTPLCAIYLTDSLTPQTLEECAKAGYKLLKLYPKGATTNSESGVSCVLDSHMRRLFEVAQDLGMIVCIHGESGGFVLEREREFGAVLIELATTFPRLKFIIEHMSDHRTIPLLETYENLYATLTLHHITLDLNALAGGALCHDHFCKPVIKTPKDKEALLGLALNAHPKVSFGSDSAPHSIESKRKGAAGIFSAPCLLPQLAELFEQHGKLGNLQAFVSDNAMRIYDFASWSPLAQKWEHNPKYICLEKAPCQIPHSVSAYQALGEAQSDELEISGEVIPLRAGEVLAWKQI